MNMKLLAVVTPPSIYHRCSNFETFGQEKFAGEEKCFLGVKMKNFGRFYFRKHKEVKGSDKSVTLDISSTFDSVNNMKTTSSESKGKFERPGKRLVTALYFKTKVRSSKYKKARYAIGKVSEQDLSKIFKESEKIGKLPYEKKRPKHEPTDSYFRLVKVTCEVYDEI